MIAIAAGALALVLWRVEWRALVDDNYVFMFNTPPQLVYFNKLLSGLVAPRYSLYFSASGLGVAAWWAGGSALVAALVAWRMRLEWRETLKRAVIALALGLAFWAKLQMKWKFPIRATPFSAVAILAPLVALFIGWRVWRARLDKTRVEFDQRLLLVVAVFGFVSTLRVILNVTINGPYTPFFLPVVIVLYLALLFRYAPEFFARQKAYRQASGSWRWRWSQWFCSRRPRIRSKFSVRTTHFRFIRRAAVSSPSRIWDGLFWMRCVSSSEPPLVITWSAYRN